jgi:hypothetical protein
LKDRNLSNDAKGKPWESVFRVLALQRCSSAPHQLQAYRLNGTAAGMVAFRVVSTEAFGPHLVPAQPPRRSARLSLGASIGAAGTYYVSSNTQYPGFDAVLPGAADASTPTLLLSMKVSKKVDADDVHASRLVFGEPQKINQRKYYGMKVCDNLAFPEANTNLASLWRKFATADQHADLLTEANKTVRFLVISPRFYNDIEWAEGTSNDYQKDTWVVPADSLAGIVDCKEFHFAP